MIYRNKWLSLVLLLFLSRPAFAADVRIQLLYFFSTACPHCKQTTPVVSELSKEFSVQGVLSGKDGPGPLPFPLRKAAKADKEQYGIQGVPTLVVLKDSKTRLVISGERDIKAGRTLIRGIEQGALTVSEAVESLRQGDVIIAGFLVSRGDYFSKNAKFILTDRRKDIYVNLWLPLEAVKSKFKKTRPRLMSDVIGMPVVLKGKLVKIETGFQLTVKEEVIVE
jgi:thiol-disulfide isomerase/thioredoxin